MKTRLLGAVCACAFTFSLFESATAATITYSSQADFLSAIGSDYVLENFESYPTDLTPKTSVTTDYFSATTVPNSGGESHFIMGDDNGNYSFNGENALVANSSTGSSFTLSFTLDAETNYIGFNAIGFGNGGDGTLTINTNAGDSFLIAEKPPSKTRNNIIFFGLLNQDQAFTEFTLVKTTLNDGIGLDEMYFSSVPIPPALYLFGSGLIGLVGMARRKTIR
jgi:hypothetical protein